MGGERTHPCDGAALAPPPPPPAAATQSNPTHAAGRRACVCVCARALQPNRFAIRNKNGPAKAGGRSNEQSDSGTDYSSKLLHLAWHPDANVIAAAASNSLYMYCA